MKNVKLNEKEQSKLKKSQKRDEIKNIVKYNNIKKRNKRVYTQKLN